MCYRHFMTVCCFILSMTVTSTLVSAQEANGIDSAASALAPDNGATRIEVDDDSDVIRFFIDGKERAFLDETGFHVHDDIGYGGIITDYGKKEFERLATEHGGGADVE